MTTISPEKWQRAKAIFYEALSLSPENRGAFVDQACEGDDAVLAEVRSLLSSSDQAGSFLQEPLAPHDKGTESSSVFAHGRTVGHYTIVKQLGKGGMGEVYLAEDNLLRRKVAIKILPTEALGNSEALRRFRQEALAASALNHPNILTIHEIGEHEGHSFIVSEYVDGSTLRELIARGAISLKSTVDLAAQVASALAAAHEAGIVHRDIKPDNIMVRHDKLVKVLDFGLVKLNTSGLTSAPEDETLAQVKTAPGILMGTVAYMSPEQARSKPTDTRTDIWSLGVVIYEMLAGFAPFTRETTTDTLAAIISAEPKTLKEVVPDTVPDEVVQIVSKMLHKDVTERYQSSGEVAAELRRVLHDLGSDYRSAGLTASKSAERETLKLEAAATTGQNAAKRHLLAWPTIAAAVVILAVASGALVYFLRYRAGASPQGAEIKTLAVLPLKSLDNGENYLGLGITDAVIRRISETGELIVRPTSAVRRYLNDDTDALTAAHQLNTDAVLEGNVQHAGDRLRVSVNLLRASDGVSLWTDNFDMRSNDIFAIQDTVAQQVATRLRPRLDASQRERLIGKSTSNPTAYEYYLKGLYEFDQRVMADKPQLEAAINFYKQAVDADPNFALAYAQLAYAYASMAAFLDTTNPEWPRRAEEAINRAESLDPQLAETHLARFQLLYSAYGGYRIDEAIRQVRLAQQTNPSVGHGEMAYLYLHLGLLDLAQTQLRLASDVDPTSEFIKSMTLLMDEVGCRFDENTAQNEPAKLSYYKLWYLEGTGRLDEAQKAIDEWSANKPNDFELPAMRALLYALRGEFDRADAEIPHILAQHPAKDPLYHHDAYDIAAVYALQGKSADAVKWLREAAVNGFQPYTKYECDHRLDRIRRSPEFTQFMAEMTSSHEQYQREFGGD